MYIYNHEEKNRFMWEAEKEIRRDSSAYFAYEPLFKTSAVVERRAGKELAELDKEEIEKAYKLILRETKMKDVRCQASLLRYFRWYRKKYSEADTDEAFEWLMTLLERYKNTVVSNPTHLQVELDKVFRPDDSETIDTIYRAFLWVAFSGLRDKDDACRIENSDVHTERMIFCFEGNEYPLYPQAIKAIEIAKNSSELNYENSNYREKVISRPRVDSTKLLRGIRQDADGAALTIGIKKKCAAACKSDPAAKRFQYRTVLHSGIFYRQFELEMSGMDIDFRDVIKKPRRIEQYASEYSRQSARYGVNARLKDEYYIWKYLMYNI